MPYSSDAHVPLIATLIRVLKPTTVCDIGPGAGKYGRLTRSVADALQHPVRVTAVEIEERYVEAFGLRAIYDDVIVADAASLIDMPPLRFDFVIIGDCIEHMRKSAGVDLINFLIYRCGYIAIVYPEAYVQDAWEGHKHEAHISVWGLDDFRGMNVVQCVKDGMHLFLIRGYQPVAAEITGMDSDKLSFR